MSIILIEGPEKAGKTTLAHELERLLNDTGLHQEVVYRHHTRPAIPDDREYSDGVRYATSLPASKLVEIWDRGWPSEVVYGTLLGQSRRTVAQPDLGYWLHGRAVQANGVRVMLQGPPAHLLGLRRTSDDLPVHPGAEQALYANYAKRFGWLLLPAYSMTKKLYTPLELAIMVLRNFEFVQEHLEETGLPSTRVIGGDITSSILVLNDPEDPQERIPGGWLPFSDMRGLGLGRMFGTQMHRVLWADVEHFPYELFGTFQAVVVFSNTIKMVVKKSLARTSRTRIVDGTKTGKLFELIAMMGKTGRLPKRQ